MPDPLIDAIAQLEEAERSLQAQVVGLTTQLEGTRRALVALREVAGMSPALASPLGRTPARIPGPRLETPVERTTPRTPAAPAGRKPRGGQALPPTAERRERQVLGLIASGTRATSLIRSALAIEPGLSAVQHQAAVANALTRLRAKALIARGQQGWELTAKGRKAAAPAAKEEP